MRQFVFVCCLIGSLSLRFAGEVCAQKREVTKTRILAGISSPELFHVGMNTDLSKSSQLAFSTGVFYSPGTPWPSISVEHRLYLGKVDEDMERKKWFFRQGITWFPSGDDVVGTLSVGLDLKSKTNYKGWTVDLGLSGFIAHPSKSDPYYVNDYRYRFIPALRIQHFMYFSKKQKHP